MLEYDIVTPMARLTSASGAADGGEPAGEFLDGGEAEEHDAYWDELEARRDVEAGCGVLSKVGSDAKGEGVDVRCTRAQPISSVDAVPVTLLITCEYLAHRPGHPTMYQATYGHGGALR
ncbi:hypothetical protein H0H81_001819 [Sphagnurus paluster]|uniref:Uncharacterized protein n=1 Tax=Sphagnurus paluster TaxID=117069 RepID=A0A9P7KN46_9AGAR|nr:hypothetical protein H0H81_001819 [Sphagnurus paluster]